MRNEKCYTTQQRWARTGLHQDWSQFWPDQDWIGLRKFCCFNVIILKISKILVLIRIHRFVKWQCILPSNAKTLLGLFCNSNCIHLCSHITLSSSSNVNLLSGSCLSLLCDCSLVLLSPLPLAQLVEVAPLIGVLLMHFSKSSGFGVYV